MPREVEPSRQLMRGRAESLMSPTPKMLAEEGQTKPPITAELIEAMKSDILRRLAPFDRKAQQQRGLTKRLAKERCE